MCDFADRSPEELETEHFQGQAAAKTGQAEKPLLHHRQEDQ